MTGRLRQVTYTRHEFHGDDVKRSASLLTFIYDIPYFDACGVCPPLHIMNQILSEGGEEGGMSPGTSWEPFTITESEYAALVDAVRSTPTSEIQQEARYAFVPMVFDKSFDNIPERMEWFAAVCQTHRKEWHNKLRNAGVMH